MKYLMKTFCKLVNKQAGSSILSLEIFQFPNYLSILIKNKIILTLIISKDLINFFKEEFLFTFKTIME